MNVSRLEKTIEHDAVLVATVQPIKILASLSWPAQAESDFLQTWRAGKPELPRVNLVCPDHSKEIEVLKNIQSRCDRGYPLDNLIFKTARSYTSSARMLGAIGTPDFTTYSIELYGKPNDIFKAQRHIQSPTTYTKPRTGLHWMRRIFFLVRPTNCWDITWCRRP